MQFSELELCCSSAAVCLHLCNRNGWPSSLNIICMLMKNLFPFPCLLCADLLLWEQFWGTNVVLPPQQASYHPDVSEEVRERALRFGTECTLGYLELLEHVLLVRSHLHVHTRSLPRRIIALASFYSSC